jgi:phenylpropionate dioxygenase-like ring-hydroxylating dioxygenase large terminal subunit
MMGESAAAARSILTADSVAIGLRRAWFPVARSQDLDRPQASTLLDKRLVVFRGSDGKAAVTDRRCPHRGGDLADGAVKENGIQCPYHGWRFDGATGACVEIPSAGTRNRLPPGARIRIEAYPVVEKYGLVWTCLGNPLNPVPNLPELDALDMKYLVGRPIPTTAGILAAAENFCDVAHFPYVHGTTMGGVSPEIETLEFRTEGHESWLSRDYVVGGAAAGTYAFDKGITVHYHACMPALVSGRFDYGPQGQRIILECFQPLGLTGCIIYPVSGTAANYTVSSPEAALADEEFVINEDKPLLDGLWPCEVSLDNSATEFSVAADRFTLATRASYRSFIERSLRSSSVSER